MKNLDSKDLEAVTRRIVEAVHPEKIILYGSHVWGAPTEESDVDLLVVVKKTEQPGYRRAREIYRSLRGISLPVEILVRTPGEMQRSGRIKASLERKILEEGRVLHAGARR
ncbi:nucleotidyltransferase domain-containing protein [Geoalkalibacter sp.]|uniref:nucleotidyltransferase domain-containing protein n=1 Tax=Geoalkalibacter sp. TaxID=3041440 RepID=UPI00272E3FA0|nr:nucleotidyltransferase domain-containing protein [Geoalkalibacter sp.]